MTQQAIAVEPKVKMSQLTLSRETVAQLAGSESSDADGRGDHGGKCTAHCSKHTCLTVLNSCDFLCSF